MAQVAVVTGGASGIGRAVALEASRFARVVVADLDGAGAGRVAEEIAAAGGASTAIVLDVTDADAVQRAVARVAEQHGRIDYMFNNAGIGGTLDMCDVTLAHWRKIVEINLMGVVHGVQAAYPIMVRQHGGHIINTASIGGLIPVPGQTLYNTTKYAVVGLSHTLRYEAARYGVRVSVVCPGPVRSSIWGKPIIGAEVAASAPSQAISAEAAAAEIWRGVRANRASIVFPRQDWLASLLYRMHPGLLSRPFARHLRAVLPR